MDLSPDIDQHPDAGLGCRPCLTVTSTALPDCVAGHRCRAGLEGGSYLIEFLPDTEGPGAAAAPAHARVTGAADSVQVVAPARLQVAAAAPGSASTTSIPLAGVCADPPRDRDLGAGDQLFVSPQGDDTASGTSVAPWRTLRHALDELQPGDTLFVHGGIYRERGLDLEERGAPEAPITIVNMPGEKVVIDGGIPEFQTAANKEWIPVVPEIDLYRSRRSYDEDPFTGKMEVDGELYALNVYDEFEAIASTKTAYDDSGHYYLGPGLHWRADDRHLYVRLQPPDPEAIHGRVFAVPEDPDPRRNRLHIGTERIGLQLDEVQNVVVKGLEIRNFLRTVDVRSAEGVSLLDLRLVPGRTGILLEEDVRDVTLQGITFDGGFPAWASWRDVKTKPRIGAWLKLSGVILRGAPTCVSITRSRFFDVFDGVAAVGAPQHLRMVQNVFDRVIDDALQLGSASAHVEFAYNLMFGPGPSHDGSGISPAAGTKYIHHNVIDIRDEELYHRVGQGEPGWRFHIPLPTHGLRDAGPDPWKIYHNTILFRPNTNNYGVGHDRKGPRSGPPHEVYNNIFLQWTDWRVARDGRVGDGAEIFDGNLYYRAVPDPQSELLAAFEYDGERRDFPSLEAFRRSDFAEATEAYYPPGWERSGVEADPELGDPERCDYRPARDSAAASGALDLSATGWPGAGDAGYRGAIDPAAATGLGPVGLTAETRCEATIDGVTRSVGSP